MQAFQQILPVLSSEASRQRICVLSPPGAFRRRFPDRARRDCLALSEEQVYVVQPAQIFCDFEGFFAIRLSRGSSALLTVDVSETRKPIFASRFTGQTGHAGNSSGNFHENPPTSAHSSNPLFKLVHDVCGSPWTRLGITGVRIPSPPSCSSLGTYINWMGWPNNESPDIRAFLLVSRETLTDVQSGM